MLKRILAVLMASVLLISLSSCSKGVGNTNTPSPSATYQTCMVNGTTGYALQNNDDDYYDSYIFYITKTEDGGSDWKNIFTRAPDQATPEPVVPALCAIDADTVYSAEYSQGRIIFNFSGDGGQTWSSSKFGLSLDWEQDGISTLLMSFSDAENGYILVGSLPGAGQMLKALYRTTDGGASWTEVIADGIANGGSTVSTGIGGYPGSMVFSTPDTGSISCSVPVPHDVLLYTTDDGGITWEAVK